METQKQAVIRLVKELLGERYSSSVDTKTQLTKSDRNAIRQSILAGIAEGKIEYKRKDEKINQTSRYIGGMITNHLKKVKELNGNTKYVGKKKEDNTKVGNFNINEDVIPDDLKDIVDA